MLPILSGAKGMEHTGLQREDGEKRLGQIQHPDGRIHRANVLSVFGDTHKAGYQLVKGKERGCDDHDLPMLFCPVPVYHLKDNTDQCQVHQQNQDTAEAIRLPLLCQCFGILSAKDLKQLDQRLSHIVDAVAADPGRA